MKRDRLKFIKITESVKNKLDESRDTRRKRTKIDEVKEPVIIFLILCKNLINLFSLFPNTSHQPNRIFHLFLI